MTYLMAIIVFGGCLALLGIGYILAKKVLTKGCALGPDCTCKTQNKSPDDCENLNK